jgi:hypothetical protein
VVIAGTLLEFALAAVLLPIGGVLRVAAGLGGNDTGNYTLFLTAVPVGCFVLGYLAAWLVVRRVSTRPLAHGLLVGIVATTFYLVGTSFNPRGLSGVIATYGTIHFWGTQIARIAGCSLGGMFSSSRRSWRCQPLELIEPVLKQHHLLGGAVFFTGVGHHEGLAVRRDVGRRATQ